MNSFFTHENIETKIELLMLRVSSSFFCIQLNMLCTADDMNKKPFFHIPSLI